MAVIYSTASGLDITIGGDSITGPFPKYSINRSIVETGDGTIIGNKYGISVTGSVLTDSSADITISGDMQSKLQLKIISKLQTDLSLGYNVGRLQIVPYGGQPNTIEFLDARLISIDIPEQSDESSGILFSDYTFNFEANDDISNADGSLFDYNLKTAEESWQIAPDQEVSYSSITGDPYYTYTITHSVSATGNRRFVNAANPGYGSAAWKEACDWVKSRLVSSPASNIIIDATGNDATVFNPQRFDSDISSASVDLQTASYLYYNHLRTPVSDLTGGTYSVSETWKASKANATIEMEVNFSQDEAQNGSVTISGSITGLDSSAVNSLTVDKIANAQAMLADLETVAFALCESVYIANNGSGDLVDVLRSKQIGVNKGTGVITFNYTYSDVAVLMTGAISTSLRIGGNNEYRDNQLIAIIPIIGKVDGPIIQDMGTTEQRTRNMQLDVVLTKAYRTRAYATAQARLIMVDVLGSTYGTAISDTSYIQTFNENWEPGTGAYSLSVEWTY